MSKVLTTRPVALASHSVDLIDPSIEVTKTGPVSIAKVGDEITYTIGFTNTGIGDSWVFAPVTIRYWVDPWVCLLPA